MEAEEQCSQCKVKQRRKNETEDDKKVVTELRSEEFHSTERGDSRT